ncbi:MAG: tRNA (N6-isopentenyl adenosine(37)-C2)-methylthiotransferase MiaB [Oligoflexia bacterium]|nr:tRNA (N6-isopentenyl adenosine(37)-C2)-methylthiotransferase MiaB [Oligoflexia bacterium]MBF0364440.1 tRNA (N6-isopentenyl adenosine(37)-C2)-methylthiotransferase MiaB [Oligoflexia bacterium]
MTTLNIENGGNAEQSKRKVFLRTYGCQMNMHDSERILSLLSDINFEECKSEFDADLILFNTCAIRDHANARFYSHLGEIKKLKEKNNELVVGVGGCVGEAEGDKLLAKYRYLDFVFAPDHLEHIPELVSKVFAAKASASASASAGAGASGGERFLWPNELSEEKEFSFAETKIVHKGPRAFVAIMKGCNNFCSYCIVPYTRGREKSRPLSEIVSDVRRLIEVDGVQEVTLLGQNVNSYDRFVELLYELEEINGLKILRYTSVHPRDMSDELIEWHGESKKLSHHLHLPVQSGSNSVLKRMNRGYTIEHYLGLLQKLRKLQPQIVLSSDMICGFPNETEEEHQASMDLLDLAQYDFIYSYAFSPREGTAAAKMEDVLTDEIRYKRLRELQLKQLSVQEKLRKQMVGKIYTILVDGADEKRGEHKWRGRTNCMRIVHFKDLGRDSDYLWKWVDVEIISSTAISSQGKVVSP